MPKSNAQTCKEYRDRLRAKNKLNKVKKNPKTTAERVREYRARKRAINLQPPPNPSLAEEIERTDNLSAGNELSATLNVPNRIFHEMLVPSVDADIPGPSAREVDVRGITVNPNLPYKDFTRFKTIHKEFDKKFKNNSFGFPCSICDRLWFQEDLRAPAKQHSEILDTIAPTMKRDEMKICNTCLRSLNTNSIPTLSVYNGFSYVQIPAHLPPLDLVSERLISPRIPFTQIRRLRHGNGQHGIYGQIINVPVEVDSMVKHLPRHLDDDHCINVHIKKKKIHKSSHLSGLINKRKIKAWLQHLITTPLYQLYDINVDDSFFNSRANQDQIPQEEISEEIPIEESLFAQQQTLLWNDDKYLRTAPGEMNVSQSLLFDEHAEELSFPSIYCGQFRTFREGVRVTPFMMATSELRRSDRRGVAPYHLLYMAMKIMRMRVRDSLAVAFKYIGKDAAITRLQVESEEYVNDCIESNLAFLRTIPNSAWYWAEQKRDLFAMIRQLGKPTIFLTVNANETGWEKLLQTLYKLKHNGAEISAHIAAQLNFIEKDTLINEDAVTCALYFNKLVNVLLTILQSKKNSPFGQYRVAHYFKRIEFQHRGSPHAHILLWLDNAPKDPLVSDKEKAIDLIDKLSSVSPSQASGNKRLVSHGHTFTCYKKISANEPQKCRFEAPFMPSRKTTILTPMQQTADGFSRYAERYKDIRVNLENNDYVDMDTFYAENRISSDKDYENILRAGINRPRVFVKRQPSEKWINAFNPFILNVLKSNMDIQFITEEYSCAQYVVEYVNKSNRGMSNLQRQIIRIMDEHPEFDIVGIIRKMSVDVLNTVEISSQEAAWYLLREPMSKSSVSIVYIPTVWPIERQRIRKRQKELNEMECGEDSTDIWKEDWFIKYEKRPEELENITLAQFVANYTQSPRGGWVQRKEPRVIRYRNYDIAYDYNEYKREMVTLHLPFRNEEEQILADMKFIEIYDEHEQTILVNRQIFESNLDIEKTIQICRDLYREGNVTDEDEGQNITNRFPEANPFEQLYNNENSEVNRDLKLAPLNQLGAIAKRRENLMPTKFLSRRS